MHHFTKKNSLIYHLILSAKNEKLSNDELIAYIMFLILAGHETTADLIGNSLLILLKNKEILHNISKNLDFIDLFIEEVLRFESPVQRTTFRVLVNDVKISDQRLKKGDQIRIFIGSVNRDESVFDMPDKFIFNRSPNPHLAFGFGPHNCIGQYLARAEAKSAILKIAPFLLKLDIVDSEPRWKYNNFSRGLESLKVKEL